MRLVIFHYHDRPGGVRQVISRGLPLLLARLGEVTEITLVLGELTDPDWIADWRLALDGIPRRVVVHSDFSYQSGGLPEIGAEAEVLMRAELSGINVLVWAHNLSVGRHLRLLQRLPNWCLAAGAWLWLHHHDWWWDGRWGRWADWLELGITDLEEALTLSIPVGPQIRHLCVNRADLSWLRIRAGTTARWVGNPLPEAVLPDVSAVETARTWLLSLSGGRQLWLAPVRALRRKNLAEGLLLARQQSEATCLVTTGGSSSLAEVPAWEAFCRASVRHGWSLVPAVLEQAASISRPSLPALLAAADAIAMPSLQEGFGLPYLEAAALGKPLLARALPTAMDNLAALGCQLTGSYSSVLVPTDSFDFSQEVARRSARWNSLISNLPRELWTDLEPLSRSDEIDFGSLSLTAQLEVLQSNPSLLQAAPHPQVPYWPEGQRVEQWAERCCRVSDVVESDLVAPTGDSALPCSGSLLTEVRRRFYSWQSQPLRWP